MHPANQEQAVSYLKRSMDKSSLSQALLLFGPGGSGKGYIAKLFAMTYLCESGTQACGECRSCRLIMKKRHPDLHIFSSRDYNNEINTVKFAAENFSITALKKIVLDFVYSIENKISSGLFKVKEKSGNKKLKYDDLAFVFNEMEKEVLNADNFSPLEGVMDELLGFLSYFPGSILPISGIRKIIDIMGKKPRTGERRVVIIEGAENLRQEGANAFLKTLEEPPSGTVIILTTSRYASILQTIKSRCTLIPVNKMKRHDVVELMKTEFGISIDFGIDQYDGVWDCIKKFEIEGKEIDKDIVAFFDIIQSSKPDAGIFDILKKYKDENDAVLFFECLNNLIKDSILKIDFSIGDELLMPKMLSNYDKNFLAVIASEIDSVMFDMVRYKLDSQYAIERILMRFYLEGIA